MLCVESDYVNLMNFIINHAILTYEIAVVHYIRTKYNTYIHKITIKTEVLVLTYECNLYGVFYAQCSLIKLTLSVNIVNIK